MKALFLLVIIFLNYGINGQNLEIKSLNEELKTPVENNVEGIQFFHGTWAEALEKAKIEDKLLFVDAYAQWCGPCKVMAKNVFTQKKVGDFFNENFINLKMDMETTDGASFGHKYPVSAYPTLFL